jgi:hypothetical protein
VLSIAAELGRILVSHDPKTMPRYFAQLRETRSSPGLIIVAQSLGIGAAIEDLILIWAVTDAEEWAERIGSYRSEPIASWAGCRNSHPAECPLTR